MLRSINIQNFVLIKSLSLNFDKGFSVITGETGAGKSILLGAINLVLGCRADSKQIKEGENKCIIEACFDISSYKLKDFFEQNDIDYDDECIFRRELNSNGRSRQFLNDSPISSSLLKIIGSKLIDIHSQHENLLLKENSFQLEIIDIIANNRAIVEQYKIQYNEYINARNKRLLLIEEADNNKKDLDYLSFQLDQLKEANLTIGEQEELESDNNTLEHATEIKSSLINCANILNDDNGILSLIYSAKNNIEAISEYSDKYNSLSNRISECFIELKDIASETERESENIEADPQRLQEINDRLNLIYSLQQKHKLQTIDCLLNLQNELEQKVSLITNYDEQLEHLQNQEQALFSELIEIAKQITKSRKNAAKLIENQLAKQLNNLAMPNAKLLIDFKQLEKPNNNGCDSVEYLFSSNKSVSPQPITKIASGGEISRIMLSIKALVSNSTNLPTIIFDEIDTGISGETASLMGDILKTMSKNTQVICITHLPQIAAKGNTHYFVHKVDAESTETQVKQLKDEERIQAIARMLSGTNITDAAYNNALDLLNEVS